MVKLRSRKPYSCRFKVAGKTCADYLTEEDTDFCRAHQQAYERFNAEPPASKHLEVAYDGRRIWP